MSVQRFSHIGICVSDLERSVHFYRDVLGFEEVSRLQLSGPEPARLLGLEGGNLRAVYLQRDGARIELIHYPDVGCEAGDTPRPMNRLGLTHVSIRVADLDAILVAIEHAGGVTLADTRIDNTAWQSKAVFILDPDGMRIELLQWPGDPDALPGKRSAPKEA